MKKRSFCTISLGLVMLALLGCQKPATPEPGEKTLDPLAEARAKLYQEIGLDQKGGASGPKAKAPLPVVSPNPPELPKTDADFSE